MKLTTTVHLMVGLLLSGCTFNHHTTIDRSLDIYAESNIHTHKEKDLIPLVAEQHVERKERAEQRADLTPRRCPIYKPPEIGAPIEIDFQRIAEAKTEAELREVLQENIAELNQQIKKHAIAQEKTYRAWARRCQ